MELFTVSLMSASSELMERLQQFLNEEFADDLHRDRTESGMIRFDMDLFVREIRCTANLTNFRLPEHGPLVYRKAATAFARYIMSEMEPLLLKAIIRKQFHYEDPTEGEIVERYCRSMLYEAQTSSEYRYSADTIAMDNQRRQAKVADEIDLFLNSHTRIHLDGFVTFRLTSYWEELREVVAYAVDEYVMDKQYQEFISLLKYFVRMQEVKLPIVNVFHNGGSEFALYDEYFQRLETAPADRIVAEMLESEMNMEDMIVSTLITVSPKQIVIHTRQPELPVMRTLETIFEQRVRLCVICEHCAPHFGETPHTAPGSVSKAASIRRILT
ncbi:putative sporulation protein YtxC [Paenibacillus spongiae]|uniref:Sporulation protein YtxC n=1 Tax=Paenibacillus spongiae TaxID=2909671 RepID=A0ABY5SCY4_9BACL|nr:putative sporulation protein YtxC [Paenibacillus spongiae]UVI31786.1 putative sporulation protein YtxC [Paenibacillus spongiae]